MVVYYKIEYTITNGDSDKEHLCRKIVGIQTRKQHELFKLIHEMLEEEHDCFEKITNVYMEPITIHLL